MDKTFINRLQMFPWWPPGMCPYLFRVEKIFQNPSLAARLNKLIRIEKIWLALISIDWHRYIFRINYRINFVWYRLGLICKLALYIWKYGTFLGVKISLFLFFVYPVDEYLAEWDGQWFTTNTGDPEQNSHEHAERFGGTSIPTKGTVYW